MEVIRPLANKPTLLADGAISSNQSYFYQLAILIIAVPSVRHSPLFTDIYAKIGTTGLPRIATPLNVIQLHLCMK